MEAAARANGRRLVILDLATGPDVGTIFAGLKQNGIEAVVLSTEAMFTVWRDQVIALAARYGIATIFPNREYVSSGGLISFGADLYEHYRVAGGYTGRILKGEKPADLPVQTPTKYELAINLKTARALGLDVPDAIRQRADKVVE
jgi:putative ABC transport system substrate-binding protein